MSDQPADAAPPCFEDSLAELQRIVHHLEEGDLGLEKSLLQFQEGIRLLRNCYRILEQAEQKIEILTGADAAGNPVTEKFDASATFAGLEKPAKQPGRRRGAVQNDPPDNTTTPAPDAGGGFQGGLF
jgi:exodeoxyribonuclease VII small subunit